MRCVSRFKEEDFKKDHNVVFVPGEMPSSLEVVEKNGELLHSLTLLQVQKEQGDSSRIPAKRIIFPISCCMFEKLKSRTLLATPDEIDYKPVRYNPKERCFMQESSDFSLMKMQDHFKEHERTTEHCSITVNAKSIFAVKGFKSTVDLWKHQSTQHVCVHKEDGGDVELKINDKGLVHRLSVPATSVHFSNLKSEPMLFINK